MHADADEWQNTILEDHVQINSVQSINEKLAALMRTVQEPRDSNIRKKT